MAREIIEHFDFQLHPASRGRGLFAVLRGIRARCGCESCKAHRAQVTRAKYLRRSNRRFKARYGEMLASFSRRP